uniref:BZIP domain-containing protein n=1 Tax=Kalanchoe fedtschenkoi TaxID=63787 RepID=A0A7N0VGI3_KALFE
MASPRVMSSSTAANSDLSPAPAPPQPAQFPSIGVQIDHSRDQPLVTVDDILKNIYGDVALSPDLAFGNGDGAGGFLPKATPSSSSAAVANDVWKEVVAGTGHVVYGGVEAQSGAMVNGGGGGGGQFQMSHQGVPVGQQGAVMVDGRVAVGTRGKRKAVEEPVVDKATQQRQRRMIKNRESAARSRERKQQYTNELETQVMQLEEERAQLKREEVCPSVAYSAFMPLYDASVIVFLL